MFCRRCATSDGKPDSSLSSASRSSAASSRRSLGHREDRDVADLGEMPAIDVARSPATAGRGRSWRARRRRSAIPASRAAGTASRARCTPGTHPRRGSRRGRSTAPTASAARCGNRGRRRPGESTRRRPPRRISRGSSTSAETMRRTLSGLPFADTYSARSVSGIVSRARIPPGSPSGCTSTVADGSGGVADRRRHRRGDVVVDGAGRRVDECVDELALALLELADDDHPDVRVAQAIAGARRAASRDRAAPPEQRARPTLSTRLKMATSVGRPVRIRSPGCRHAASAVSLSSANCSVPSRLERLLSQLSSGKSNAARRDPCRSRARRPSPHSASASMSQSDAAHVLDLFVERVRERIVCPRVPRRRLRRSTGPSISAAAQSSSTAASSTTSQSRGLPSHSPPSPFVSGCPMMLSISPTAGDR